MSTTAEKPREPLEVEVRREALTELDEAKHEHAALFKQWRALDPRADAIRRERLSDLDRTLALAELRREKEDLAPRLKAAILRLQAARVAAANDKLRPLVSRHRDAAKRAERSRRRAEKALAELQAALIVAGEHFSAEEMLARSILKAAGPAVAGEDEKAQMRNDARYQLPVHFGEHGEVEEYADRPARGFFEGPRELTDETAFRGLEKLAKLDRRRALANLGRVWRAEVEKALEKIN